MKIKMLKDQLVASDGLKPVLWKAGEEHEIADADGASMVAAELAAEVKSKATTPAENKAAGPSEKK